MTEIEINFEEAPEPTHESPEDGDRTRGWQWLPGVVAGVTLVFAGMLMTFVSAIMDAHSVFDKPWNTAFILFEVPDSLPPVDSRPVWARRVSRTGPLKEDAALKLLEVIVNWERFEQPVRLSEPELLIGLDLPESEQSKLLASGRLPTPGASEVLAGSLAREESFGVDGIQFSVVGRLHDTVSGFLFAYMLPHASDFKGLFAADANAVQGLLVINGGVLLDAGLLPEKIRRPGSSENIVVVDDVASLPAASGVAAGEPEEGEPKEAPLTLPAYTGGLLVTHPGVAVTAIMGLMIAALGGAIAHYYLFRLLLARRYRPLYAILSEINKRSGLFICLHIVMYSVFFYSMYAAIRNPLITYRITQYIEAVFSHGGLGYIGEAYASGDVVRAAWMTFYNNYIEQTLGLTFLISLFPVPFGFIKNLLSFALVGGALAPLWVGASQAYVLHVITMVLELQSYIIACFAIIAWPLHLFQGIRLGRGFASVKSGLLMLFSAAILTGAMLGVAAFYEAFTLIHLMTP
ncbi:MAG TPA: hypothetical protein ENN29_13075 [Candidatus Hydrogenedentes bacterium]|nr:hypothetical protein [Candidatus Hydrogenedentota bacterium]